MNQLFKLCLSLSLSGTILILVLVFLRPFYQRNMSKAWQYYIWLVVIARLLFPFAPDPNLVGNLFQNFEYTLSQPKMTVTPQPAQAGETGTETDIPLKALNDEGRGETANYLFVPVNHIGLIWLFVALLLLIRKVTIYQGFIKYIKAGRIPVDDINLLEQFGREIDEAKIKVSIELYTNKLISSPMLLGFFRPWIVMPVTECSDMDFQYIVRHELTHFKRKDMFYKWLILITVCLHWFNPLVFPMARYVNRLCELSCDEVLIGNLNERGMRDYGNTLLGAIKTGGNYENTLASVTLNESKELLKERLDAIMKYKKQSRSIKIISFAMTFALCLGGIFTGAYAAGSDSLKSVSKQEHTLAAKANVSGDVAFYMSSGGNDRIVQSGSFEAKDNQVLTITVQSDIKEGSVNVTLFSPGFKEQRFTFTDSDEMKTIELSAGRWGYNATGFFNSGQITIKGLVTDLGERTKNSNKTGLETAVGPGVERESESTTKPVGERESVGETEPGTETNGEVEPAVEPTTETNGVVKPAVEPTTEKNGEAKPAAKPETETNGETKPEPAAEPTAEPHTKTVNSKVTVVNLKNNNNQKSLIQSGSFEAQDNQVLTLSVQSDIKGGSVDFTLFSPDYKEQRFTFTDSDEIKTISLSAGRWAYNCTGFFESGNVTLIGEIQ